MVYRCGGVIIGTGNGSKVRSDTGVESNIGVRCDIVRGTIRCGEWLLVPGQTRQKVVVVKV